MMISVIQFQQTGPRLIPQSFTRVPSRCSACGQSTERNPAPGRPTDRVPKNNQLIQTTAFWMRENPRSLVTSWRPTKKTTVSGLSSPL